MTLSPAVTATPETADLNQPGNYIQSGLVYGFLTFLLSCAYCSLWIWQGLDMTDEGFHLSTQWGLMTGSPAADAGWVIYFSNAIGAWWLSLASDPGVIWARVGWVVLSGLTALAAYCVLFRYAAPRQLCLALTLTTILSNHWGKMTVGYDTVPPLFYILCVGCLAEAFRPTQARWRSALLAGLAGLALGLCIFAKMTYLVTICVMPLPWILAGSFRPAISGRWKLLVWTCAGVTACILLSYWHLQATEYLEKYVAAVINTARPEGPKASHNPTSLLATYGWQAGKMLKGLCVVGIGGAIVYGVHALQVRLGKRGLSPAWLVIGFLTLFALYQIWKPASISGGYFYSLHGIILLAGAGVLWTAYQRHHRTNELAPVMTLICGALFFPLASMAGSNSGVIKMSFGLWLIVPLIVFYLPHLVDTWRRANEPTERAGGRKLVMAALCCLAVASLLTRTQCAQRDCRSRRQLTKSIPHPRLQLVCTSDARAESLGALLTALQVRVEQGEPLLAFRSTPMLNYLTCTVPALGNSWPEIIPPETIRERLETLANTRQLPAVAVRALVNPRHRDWEREPVQELDEEQAREIEAFLRANGYREVWSNSHFVIYQHPEIR